MIQSHEDAWKQFLKICKEIDSVEKLDAFFGFIFTLDEKEQLSTRIQLTKALLDADLPQREISKRLNISIAKITRGSNALKTIDPNLRDFLHTFFKASALSK